MRSRGESSAKTSSVRAAEYKERMRALYSYIPAKKGRGRFYNIRPGKVLAKKFTNVYGHE